MLITTVALFTDTVFVLAEALSSSPSPQTAHT